jgi:peptide/nickel transport system substrate-binding protein
MKKIRWQILIIVITLIVVGVLLLTQQPPNNPAEPAPTSGGIYTEALIGSFGRLNPLLDLKNPSDRDIDRLIFSRLIKFDSKGVPQPDLAESWGISADGTVYNVTLRANAQWQDGIPVTSDDVLFTINLLRSEYSAYPTDVRSMWDQVEVSRLDEKNIKFVLPEPFVPFLDYLSFGILPQHILQTISPDQLASAQFNLAPVGSGPYKFDHLNTQNGEITGVVLSISKNYYAPVSFIEQVVFRYFQTPEAALNAYKQGEVLGISQIPPNELISSCSNSNLSCYSSRIPSLTMILLNLGNNDVPFLQDKNIRRALLSGLNRQWMVDNLLQGQAVVANSPILPLTWAYYDGVEQIGFDPDIAINEFKTAGYTLPPVGTVRVKDNVQLSFTMVYPDDKIHTLLAQSIQQFWAAIGIELKLQAVSYESLFNDFLTPRNYEAVLVDLDMIRAYDPDPYPFWHQAEITGGQNYSQWDNRTASEYLEQARVIADPNIRTRLYRNFQVIFSREIPALLLYYPIYTFGIDQRVQGVQAVPLFEPTDRFNWISSWYLITRRALGQTEQLIITP